MGQDKAVNGLRGISALSVLGYHALGFGVVASTFFRLGFGGGFAAVYVFFALSAFLLTRTKPLSWSSYYTHRLFRIFPVWLVVLPSFVLLGILPFSPWAIALLQNFIPTLSGIANPTWTLTIELVFYACLPLWMRALDRYPLALFVGCAVVTAFGLTFAQAPVFGFAARALPAALAYACGSLAARGRFPSVGAVPATALMVGAFGLAAVVPTTAAVLIALGSGLVLTSLPRPLARLDSIGAMAYPIYLLGYPLLFVGRDLFPNPWVVVVFNVVACVALAWVIHKTVEQPAIRAGKIACDVLALHKSTGTV